MTYGHDSWVLIPPAIAIVWRWPCLPRLRWFCPLAIVVCLVVFQSWLAPQLIPRWDACWSLSALDACSALGLGWLPVPSSHFQDSVSCLTCSHDSQLLRLPVIDIVWRWPCLPRFRLLQTPCYSGTLDGLHVLVGTLTYSSPGHMFEPSYIGRLLCLRLGWRPVPSSHFQDSVYCMACSLDSCSYGFQR